MARRRAVLVTDGELRKLREPCPVRTCKGHAAQMVLSRASWKECMTCGHQWRFRDASSKLVTREQKDELIQSRSSNQSAGKAEERRAGARRMEQYRQEAQEMTKSTKATKAAKGAEQKKAKKVAKKKDPNGAARKTISSVIREELKKNPTASNDAILAAFKKVFPDMKGHRARTANDVNWFRRELGITKPTAKPTKAIKKPKTD